MAVQAMADLKRGRPGTTEERRALTLDTILSFPHVRDKLKTFLQDHSQMPWSELKGKLHKFMIAERIPLRVRGDMIVAYWR